METLRCRQKQDEVTSGALIVAPSGQKGFFYFDRVKPTRFLEKLQRDSWKERQPPKLISDFRLGNGREFLGIEAF